MNKKLLKVTWVIGIIFICLMAGFAQSAIPTTDITEVKKVVLRMNYNSDVEKFEGYLVFYNKERQQCAVEPLSSPTYRSSVPWIKGILPRAANKVLIEQRLEITPDKFEVLKLRNGDEILAYRLEFFADGHFNSGNIVQFDFEWLNLQASSECMVSY